MITDVTTVSYSGHDFAYRAAHSSGLFNGMLSKNFPKSVFGNQFATVPRVPRARQCRARAAVR
jgi:hypothetical protein